MAKKAINLGQNITRHLNGIKNSGLRSDPLHILANYNSISSLFIKLMTTLSEHLFLDKLSLTSVIVSKQTLPLEIVISMTLAPLSAL